MVDVLFDAAGEAILDHRTPEHTYRLGSVEVADERAEAGPAEAFENLRTNPDMVAERERIAAYLDAEPDKTLALVAELDFEAPDGATEYCCPMHPEVVGPEPGNYAARAIEWEDDMVEVNKDTTLANTRWRLIDRDRRLGQGHRLAVQGRRPGEIRLVNEMDSDHPMHHPFHIHGAGRFLVLTRDGVVEPNLVWTDAVPVTPGEVLDCCWTSPTPVAGWRTATSPNTTRAA